VLPALRAAGNAAPQQGLLQAAGMQAAPMQQYATAPAAAPGNQLLAAIQQTLGAQGARQLLPDTCTGAPARCRSCLAQKLPCAEAAWLRSCPVGEAEGSCNMRPRELRRLGWASPCTGLLPGAAADRCSLALAAGSAAGAVQALAALLQQTNQAAPAAAQGYNGQTGPMAAALPAVQQGMGPGQGMGGGGGGYMGQVCWLSPGAMVHLGLTMLHLGPSWRMAPARVTCSVHPQPSQ
jgi:hypothetical protein